MDEVEKIHEILREKDKAREESIRKVRSLIRTCGDGIRSLHRGEAERADQAAGEARGCVEELLALLQPHPDLANSGPVRAGLAEYAELTIVLGLVRERSLPSFGEVDVPPVAYLSGLGDAIGEIRRHVLDLMRARQTDKAEAYLEIMEGMYDMLMSFDYPKALVGELRRKQDIARSLLERTRADVTNAVLQKDLSERLKDSGG